MKKIKTLIKTLIPKFILNKLEILHKKKYFRQFGIDDVPFLKKIILYKNIFYIKLNPFMNGTVDLTIARNGFWEKEVSEIMIKYLNTGETFLDIGANIGYHSLFLSAYFKNDLKIYAFEPIKSLYAQFNESIKLNKFYNISLLQFAVSNKRDNKKVLYIREDNIGGSSLYSYPKINFFKTRQKEIVEVVNLDSFFDNNFKINLIKLDVEGNELEVIKGGLSLIKKNKPFIVLEFSPIFYVQDYKEKSIELLNLLKDLGYKLFTLDEKPFDFESCLDLNEIEQIDLLCKPI